MSAQSILDGDPSPRPSQSDALAALSAAAAVRSERLNLASIGRRMAGSGPAKPTFKRPLRFTCMLATRSTKPRRRGQEGDQTAQNPLIVGLDWIDVRDFRTLMTATWIAGRTVPQHWSNLSSLETARF